jgi:hypothetical protein
METDKLIEQLNNAFSVSWSDIGETIAKCLLSRYIN